MKLLSWEQNICYATVGHLSQLLGIKPATTKICTCSPVCRLGISFYGCILFRLHQNGHPVRSKKCYVDGFVKKKVSYNTVNFEVDLFIKWYIGFCSAFYINSLPRRYTQYLRVIPWSSHSKREENLFYLLFNIWIYEALWNNFDGIDIQVIWKYFRGRHWRSVVVKSALNVRGPSTPSPPS